MICLLALSPLACAGEIRGPVYPAHFDGSVYKITGADAPSLLRGLELLYIDTSGGFSIDKDHFYYAGLNSNKKTDYLGLDYVIQKIGHETVLYRNVWKKDDKINLNIGKPLVMKDGYVIELVDIGKDGEQGHLQLKKNGDVVKDNVVRLNNKFTYTQEFAGEDVLIFSTTVDNIISSNTTRTALLKNTFVRTVKIVYDGESVGENYTVDINDIDNDGDLDIVVRLKDGKSLPLIRDRTIPILNNYLFIKSGMMYNSFYDELDKFLLVASSDDHKIYSTKNQNLNTGVTNLLEHPPSGSIIAVTPSINVNTKVNVATNKSASLAIDRTLRGGHTFYTCIDNETLEFTVTKQDMNWYNGSDDLKITVYSDSGEEKGSITIPDDGNANKGGTGPMQNQTITIPGLETGMYRVEMSAGADLYINNITTEQDKLIADGRLFIISPQSIYTEMKKGGTIKFQTYHDSALQNITITNGATTAYVDVNQAHNWFEISLPPGDTPYEINLPKGDMIIESDGYLSFTRDSYFNPVACTVLSLQNNMAWIDENNIDYIVVPANAEQFGFYVFKKTGSKYSVRSPTNPWSVYTIDSWTAGGLFHFDFDIYRTLEYLTLNNSAGSVIDRDHFSYDSIQTAKEPASATVFDWSLAYLGTPYHVLSVDSSKAILSRKIIDDLEATLTYDSPLELNDEYSLILNEIDQNGDLAWLTLKKNDIILESSVVMEGDTFYYNTTVNGTDVSMFGARVDNIFLSGSKGIVKVKRINLIDDDPLIIKARDKVGTDYIVELLDLNDDSRTDLRVRLDSGRTITLKKDSKISILDEFLTIVVDKNGRFYILRSIESQPVAGAVDQSYVKNEEQYVLSWLMPTTNAVFMFEKSSIEQISLNLKNELNSIYAAVQELNERPADVNPLEGQIYGIYNLIIDPSDITNASIDFKVEQAWLSENNVSKADVKLARHYKNDWDELDTIIRDEDSKFVHYTSITPGFSLFAIFAEKKPVEITIQLTSQIPASPNGQVQSEQSQSTPQESDVVQHKAKYFGLFFMLNGIFLLGYWGYHKRDNLKTFNHRVYDNDTIKGLISINQELFSTLLISYLMLLLIENIWETSVSAHLNLNQLLTLTIASGVISVLTTREENTINSETSQITVKDYVFILLAGLAGAVIIWYKTQEIGAISYIISILSGILIILLSLLVMEEDEIEDTVKNETNEN